MQDNCRAGARGIRAVGDREGLERWSCSPLSRAPGRAAGRWTWALGRVPTWTERCSGAGSTRLLLLGLPRRTSRKKRRTGNLEQETGSHKIDEKLDQIKTNRDQTFHRPSQGSCEHTLRDHRPISTPTPGKLDHGQEHEKLPKNEIRSISSYSTRFNQIHLRGSINSCHSTNLSKKERTKSVSK